MIILTTLVKRTIKKYPSTTHNKTVYMRVIRLPL